jgi:hypothetical protein
MQFRPHALILAAAALCASSLAGAGAVTVSLNHPERFTDAVDAPQPYPIASLQMLTGYLQMLGQKYLPPEQTLFIELVDLDLVGKLRPSHRTSTGWIRVATSPLDWPHAKLRYRLEANGRVLKSGEESISDMAFMSHIGIYGADPLRYEKRMFNEWFRARFAAPS